MHDRAAELITKIKEAPDDDALIRKLKDQKPLIFFRVSIITDDRKVIYDSHVKRVLGPKFNHEYVVDHPEVLDAIIKGEGYYEDYSQILGQKFSYFAKSFDFNGKTYVLRTAFPYKYVTEAERDFEVGFIAVAAMILLLFSFMTWFVINILTEPISQITSAVTPFQAGLTSELPIINLNVPTNDEFGKLAETLNLLSSRVRDQIHTLTEERNEKEAVLESLGEGVVAVDHTFEVTYANQPAIKLLNYDKEVSQSGILRIQNQKQCYELLKSCQREGRMLTDTITFPGEGNRIFVDIIAAPKRDGTGAILVLQDKTSHYRLLEMRKDFIANASHELKTPITIIKGFAETLHDNPELPQEMTTDITGKIVRNCNRMTNIIKDLLTLSDIENIPESRLEKCDMVRICNNCRDMVLNVHKDAYIEVIDATGKGATLVADPSLIELAMLNLIENAAKYSNPPAHITVTLENFDTFIQISVVDKGIGIPQADLEHVFDRFYTVNKAHSRKMGGSGLGLSIVQTVVQKHFGKIKVTSEMGVGTTFVIKLPVRELPVDQA